MAGKVPRDDVCVFVNSDIYLDETAELFNLLGDKECWALARWENGGCFNRPDAQDAWAFRGPPPNVGATFGPGVLGCDNKLAFLIKRCGWKVSNPALSVKCHHLHATGLRRYERGKSPLVAAPYHTVWPTYLAAARTNA
jgi:hypothetical protein